MGKAKFQHDFFDHKWKISDIPSEYLSEKDGVKLLAIGKIHESGEGCACPMGIIARQFISNLKLDPNEVVITDTEAGIEHFGRGVETDVDAILMVIDPSYESLQLSAKVAELSESIHKPLYYVLNKVNASNESLMKEAVKDKSKIIAVIPTNDSISMAGLKGDELNAEWSGIKGLADFLSENVC
jgi:CO dehydrogenase maturation factor